MQTVVPSFQPPKEHRFGFSLENVFHPSLGHLCGVDKADKAEGHKTCPGCYRMHNVVLVPLRI